MPRRLSSRHQNFADAIFDFLPDATIVIDRDGNVIAWNKAMETLTGVPAKEMFDDNSHHPQPPNHIAFILPAPKPPSRMNY